MTATMLLIGNRSGHILKYYRVIVVITRLRAGSRCFYDPDPGIPNSEIIPLNFLLFLQNRKSFYTRCDVSPLIFQKKIFNPNPDPGIPKFFFQSGIPIQVKYRSPVLIYSIPVSGQIPKPNIDPFYSSLGSNTETLVLIHSIPVSGQMSKP